MKMGRGKRVNGRRRGINNGSGMMCFMKALSSIAH